MEGIQLHPRHNPRSVRQWVQYTGEGESVTKNFTWLEPDGFVPTFASSHYLILQKVGDSVTL